MKGEQIDADGIGQFDAIEPEAFRSLVSSLHKSFYDGGTARAVLIEIDQDGVFKACSMPKEYIEENGYLALPNAFQEGRFLHWPTKGRNI